MAKGISDAAVLQSLLQMMDSVALGKLGMLAFDVTINCEDLLPQFRARSATSAATRALPAPLLKRTQKMWSMEDPARPAVRLPSVHYGDHCVIKAAVLYRANCLADSFESLLVGRGDLLRVMHLDGRSRFSVNLLLEHLPAVPQKPQNKLKVGFAYAAVDFAQAAPLLVKAPVRLPKPILAKQLLHLPVELLHPFAQLRDFEARLIPTGFHRLNLSPLADAAQHEAALDFKNGHARPTHRRATFLPRDIRGQRPLPSAREGSVIAFPIAPAIILGRGSPRRQR